MSEGLSGNVEHFRRVACDTAFRQSLKDMEVGCPIWYHQPHVAIKHLEYGHPN